MDTLRFGLYGSTGSPQGMVGHASLWIVRFSDLPIFRRFGLRLIWDLWIRFAAAFGGVGHASLWLTDCPIFRRFGLRLNWIFGLSDLPTVWASVELGSLD
jgi:hypothetical protein